MNEKITMTKDEALKLALEALDCIYSPLHVREIEKVGNAMKAIKEALAQPEFVLNGIDCSCGRKWRIVKNTLTASAQPERVASQEPMAWISVKDALPKAVRGLSYKKSITDTVLVRHSDRPDYPITAHAVLGEGLGSGISILTEGASEYPEIAWYSASSDLNNPFGLKNDDYERYLPRVFGSKITHWMPITTPPQRKPLTDVQIATLYWGATGQSLRPQDNALAHKFARAIEAAHGIKGDA